MALGISLGWDLTMAPGSRAGLFQQASPLYLRVYSFISLNNAEAALLLFLFHLTTVYSHTVLAPTAGRPHG